MFMYSSLEVLAAPAQPAHEPDHVPYPAAEKASNDPLSFVVDLSELGMNQAYRAHEVHRSRQCLIYARVGPEYVNPRSGHREQANWIL